MNIEINIVTVLGKDLKNIREETAHLAILKSRKYVNCSLPEDTAEIETEPVFVKNYEAQESIPRNRFRQLMYPGGPVRQTGLLYRLARLGIDFWAP
jgi:hypothetical protein